MTIRRTSYQVFSVVLSKRSAPKDPFSPPTSIRSTDFPPLPASASPVQVLALREVRSSATGEILKRGWCSAQRIFQSTPAGGRRTTTGVFGSATSRNKKVTRRRHNQLSQTCRLAGGSRPSPTFEVSRAGPWSRRAAQFFGFALACGEFAQHPPAGVSPRPTQKRCC